MIKRAETEKLSVSLPCDITKWLRKQAATRRTSVSFLIREALLPGFDSRNTKTKGKVSE